MENLITQAPEQTEVTAIESPIVEAAAVESAAEPTMRETIEAKYKEIQARGNQERDETGKFAGNTEKAAEPDVSRETIEIKKAPSSWKKEAIADWQKLPSVVQDEVLRRESDIHKGIESYKSKAAMADQFEKAMSPYQATLQSLNVAPHELVSDLLRADHMMRHGSPSEKNALFRQFATQFGVDLNQIPQQQYVDPQIAPLYQEINNLKSQQAQVQEQQKVRETNELNSVIGDFAKGKEHFEAVRGHMGQLIQAGLAQDLPTAYEMACQIDPDIRSALSVKQQEQEKIERQAKLKQVKTAASVNVASKAPIASKEPVGTMRDTIRAKAQELGFIN